jgi:hypothetical protein
MYYSLRPRAAPFVWAGIKASRRAVYPLTLPLVIPSMKRRLNRMYSTMMGSMVMALARNIPDGRDFRYPINIPSGLKYVLKPKLSPFQNQSQYQISDYLVLASL